MLGRAGATTGEAVFLKKRNEDLRTLAFVESFDGNKYVIKMRGDEGQWKARTIDLDRASNGAEWTNESLPACLVCLDDGKANVALPCRCTVPLVCAECAARIRKRPQCRERVCGSAECESILDREERGLCEESKRDCRTRALVGRFPRVHAIEFPLRTKRVQIWIKSMTGGTTTVHVSLEWTVRTVKAFILAECNVPIHQQRLVYSMRQLEDERTLSDYGIEQESTLHIILRLCGD